MQKTITTEFTPDEIGTWESEAKPDYWAHIVMKSTRTEEMVAWYKVVMGARIVFKNAQLTFLTWDNEHHRLAIIRMPGVFRIFRPLARVARKFFGVDHIAFNMGSLEKLLLMHERIKQQGIDPIWCINHGPTTSIYYEDPDGNRLEFQTENFDTPKDLQAFAESGEFIQNPIGVEFDPTYLLELYRAGTPELELKKRGSGTRPGQPVIGGKKSLNWRTL